MKKIFILYAIIVLILPFINASDVSACTYVARTDQETYNQNEHVFIGKITNISVKNGIGGTYTVTFQVLKTYKGSFSGTVTLTTGANGAMCGFEEGDLATGDTWVIHTSSDESFNSLPQNKWYEFFEDAKSYLDPLAQNDEPKFCTLQYDPVCAQKATEIKTYGNSCQAFVDKAEVLYTGECKVSGVDPIKPQPKPQIPNPVIDDTPVDYQVDGMYEVPQVETNGDSLAEKLWEKVKSFWKWLFRID